MKKATILFIIGLLINVKVKAQTDFNTYLFDDFTPWCTVFEAHHGTPASHGVLMAHLLWRGDPFCLGQVTSEGEGIVSDFNFIKNASYSVNVNVSSFTMQNNKDAKFTVMLVNNPVKIGCAGGGTSTNPLLQPIPTYSNSYILASHFITSDITTSTNFQIDFTAPDNFSSIVIYPQDLDPKCRPWEDFDKSEVHLDLNCVNIGLYCYGDVVRTYNQQIPNSTDGAKIFYIGSNYGNSGGLATNSNGKNTDIRATNSIFISPNTLIEPKDNSFVAQIYSCNYPKMNFDKPIVTINNTNSCGNSKPNVDKFSEGKTINQSSLSTTNNDNLKNSLNSKDVDIVQNSFTIYPNPCNSNFNIQTQEENYTISILNIEGKKIITHRNLKGDFNIEMKNCCKGLYIIDFIDNKNKHTYSKIFVE